MKHYIVVSYLSIFQRELKMFEYKQKVTTEEKSVYGILTNEAGIQAILDCIKEESDGQEYTVDIFYFRSEATNSASVEKRKRFYDFYERYNKVISGDLSFISELKKDIPYKKGEENIQELSESEYYKLIVERFAKIRNIPNVSVEDIPVNENSNIMDASKEQIQELIHKLDALKEKYCADNKEFSFYIDSTGGPRDFSFLCIMLIKLLDLAGYNMNKIVYSNINGKPDKEIISLNSTYEMLDISNGVNEFIKYGHVSALKKSLGRGTESGNAEDSIDDLLVAMEEYSNKMAVCDLQELDSIFDTIDSKMKEIENNVESVDSRIQIMKLQFNDIRRQMGIQNPNEQFLILLKNYIDNAMLQQAITFYNERMPYYLMNTLGLLTISDSVVKKKDYESDIYYMRKKMEKMMHGFSNKSGKELEKEFFKKDSALSDTEGFAGGIYVLEHIEDYQDVTISASNKRNEIINTIKDYVIIRELRNHMNHVSEETINKIMNIKSRDFYGLDISGNVSLFDIVKRHINRAYDNLVALGEEKG